MRRRNQPEPVNTEPEVEISDLTDSEVQRALLIEQVENNALTRLLIHKVDELDSTIRFTQQAS